MADGKDRLPQEPEEAREPVAYASPVKRAWAWVGIVYMLMFVGGFTWYLATARFLTGTGPLLLCPALAGLGATAVLRFRAGQSRGGLPACILFTAVCALLFLYNLAVGVPALLQNFGG